MATRRRDEESRISRLPIHILQHILSFIPQRDAIRTCVLSKTWRHLGPTRPNVVLRESSNAKGSFVPALEMTLQTYQDHKISVQDLHLEMWSSSSLIEYSPILEKSFKKLKTFRLGFTNYQHQLPPFIFEAEFLEEIYLTNLTLTNPIHVKLLFKHLKKLHLKNCYIGDEISVNIISSCPLIEYLVLDSCHQLVKFNSHSPRLKSLYLHQVRLSAESFHNLSSQNYFPRLEELEIDSCFHGFEDFVLSSRSIKRLIISDMSCKSWAIDAPNILYFKASINCFGRTPSFSVTTTSREWKSQIETLHEHCYYVANRDAVSTCLLLKALSQSRISFKPYCPYSIKINDDVHFTCEPAVVEHLDLSSCFSLKSSADMLCYFFRICRPRYMSGMFPGITAEIEPHSSGELTSSCKSKSKIIIKYGLGMNELQHCFWQQDLEELSCEIWDGIAERWGRVQLSILNHKTLCALSEKKHIRYRLKWRGEKIG